MSALFDEAGPGTLAERRLRRSSIRTAAVTKAEMTAINPYLSMKCHGPYTESGEPVHAFEPGGCKNDGTGCLCECHDPPT